VLASFLAERLTVPSHPIRPGHDTTSQDPTTNAGEDHR
jgi:hypothetical protein